MSDETKPAEPTGHPVHCRMCGRWMDAGVWPIHAAVEHGISLSELADAPVMRLRDRLARVSTTHLLGRSSARWHAWRSLDQRGGSLIEATAEEIKKQYSKR